MEGGGWKRIAFGENKERFVQKNGFWFVKMGIFADSEERYVQKKFLCVRKRL